MIRLKIDVLKELKSAGYSAYKLRSDGLLSESTMQNIRKAYNENSNISINTKQIDTICAILKNQPGQIIEYVKDE